VANTRKDFFIKQFQSAKVVIGCVTGLIDFSAAEVLVRVGGGTITVAGADLVIDRFDENEIIIIGKIHGVTTNVR